MILYQLIPSDSKPGKKKKKEKKKDSAVFAAAEEVSAEK